MSIGSENWNLTVFRDSLAASLGAADVVSAVIAGNPHAAVSFPTGSTPLGMFDVLAARAARGEIDFSRASVFCLDEYLGVTIEDQNSLTRWLRDGFLHRIGMTLDRLHSLPVTADDLAAAATKYEDVISA